MDGGVGCDDVGSIFKSDIEKICINTSIKFIINFKNKILYVWVNVLIILTLHWETDIKASATKATKPKKCALEVPIVR